MMSRRSLFGPLLAGVLLAALPVGALAQSPAAGLEGIDWRLTRIAGSGVPFIEVPPSVDATLRVDGASAGGQGGCNSWFGDVAVDGDSITFSGVGSTMMACEEPAMSFEGQYLGVLEDIRRWAIVDGALELSDGAGAVLLVFAGPGQTDTLEGVDWQVTSLLVDGVLGDVPAGVVVTIRLDGGQAGGSAGCNTYGGGYQLADGSLTFAPMAATEMACPEPRMTIEGAWLTALGLVTEWRVRDGMLHLLDAAGNDLAVLEVAAAATAVGTWVLAQLGDGQGGLQLVETDATITLGENGRVTGDTGCNRLNGDVTLGDGAIAFGPVATTKMACVDPGASEVEAGLLAALEGAAGWHLDDAGWLILTDPAGTVLAGFTPEGTVSAT